MKLIKLLAALAIWGLVVWMAAKFGLSAGIAAITIILLSAIIETANDWIERGE